MILNLMNDNWGSKYTAKYEMPEEIALKIREKYLLPNVPEKNLFQTSLTRIKQSLIPDDISQSVPMRKKTLVVEFFFSLWNIYH